jgi:hypothetical protein
LDTRWLNLTSIKASQTEKDRIAQLYRSLGLNIKPAIQGEEAAVYHLWQLLASNKLKVFANLSGFLAEYRIGDDESPLLLCCHALVLSSRHCMYPKPVPRPPELFQGSPRRYLGEGSWMI